MKRFLLSISLLLLLRSEVVSLAVVAVLAFYGLAKFLEAAAKGGAFDVSIATSLRNNHLCQA